MYQEKENHKLNVVSIQWGNNTFGEFFSPFYQIYVFDQFSETWFTISIDKFQLGNSFIVPCCLDES